MENAITITNGKTRKKLPASKRRTALFSNSVIKNANAFITADIKVYFLIFAYKSDTNRISPPFLERAARKPK